MVWMQKLLRVTAADGKHVAVVATLLFLIYALTSPSTVALEDDSLFILSSYFLGIEHPPGYPLFTLIGHLFSLLPFGSVAYRVHLVSALFGALSVAAVWICARRLLDARLPAYLSAFALGLSPVFWSQSIIAEVYTLNTFFFLILVYLGLRACPPNADGVAVCQPALLPAMAFVFGLSLSNHWPLMLLVAPAFVVLLWPLRAELLRRLPVLVWCALLGLIPYVWMIYRSWKALPISFYGPLETLPQIWYFVSRAGYAEVDQSLSANWLDRVKFLRFLGGQLLVQFALVGTVLAAIGFTIQWRVVGRRAAWFLTIAFLMPSVVLLMLLGFDYSVLSKHVFHVYPLPAYAVAALWMALGFAWLARRYALSASHSVAGAAAVVALILTVAVRTNVFTDHGWGARYARAVLSTLPKNAVVFGRGEVDLGIPAYYHMVENQRPDITLFQSRGLILGNRLLDPLSANEQTRVRALREAIDRRTEPVVFTMEVMPHYARVDRWLYTQVDKSSADSEKVTVDIPEEAISFLEESVLGADDPNAWVAFFQCQLRRRYGELLGQSLRRSEPSHARTARHLQRLGEDFCGALGVAEGLMRNSEGYSVGAVAAFLDRARELMPSDVIKDDLARYFSLQAALRASLKDEAGAIRDFELAFSVWPHADNPAIQPLQALYRNAGDTAALHALQQRVEQRRRRGL